jgi:glycosyltransferase involved in cell wall biosynthesis
MKKIAIFVNTLQSGGSEKQSIFLLNALKDHYQTYFIVFYGKRIEEKIFQMIKGENFNLIRLQGSVFIKLIYLHKIFHSNNITHLFTYLTKPNFLGALIGSITGIKKIYGGIRSSKFPLWKLIIEKFTSNILSSSTIANNYKGAALLHEHGFRKTLVIPNCFPLIKTTIRHQSKSRVIIISVGRFVEVKDYQTAILAMSILKKTIPDFLFQIVGYGKLEFQIRKWIVEENLEDNINIFLNPNNIPELLDFADIYLSTSLYEGTSNSIMEAMNASLPIVATNVGDNNRLVKKSENGFLHNVGDITGISKSLEVLINDFEKRTEFGIKSNLFLRENYSFEKFKESYIQLIEKE